MKPSSRAARSTSAIRLWIALWLVRGDADAPAELHQVDDQPRAGVGLPGAGRPLDHEVAAVEPGDELLRRLEVVLRERGRERLAARGSTSTRE